MFKLSFLVLALSLASTALAGPPPGSTNTTSFCGTVISDERIALAEKDFQTKLSTNKRSATLSDENLSAADVEIPVYWNVIYANTTYSGGYISDDMIDNQINVVNAAFSGTGIQFVLENLNRVQDEYWFDYVDPETAQPQTDMKSTLRFDGYGPAALNIYSLGLTYITNQGTLGYAAFPSDYNSNPTNDGILISYTTLPGGTAPGNNLGEVLTHEIGHWVGLYHTFQGGCLAPGDYVDDTPPEALPARGCPSGLDTCAGGGVDPINNFMDYTTDACRNQYTAGQVQRLQDQISVYRGIIV